MKISLLTLRSILILVVVMKAFIASACRWDADTLRDEKKKKPEIAEIIFGTHEEEVDVARLQKRISDLKANPRRDDPDWWNNFAGAYIQLGQSQKAADLLEPVLEKFKDNYGVHANLGTAYHLLGRYRDAEKEIARDLKINPDAHFGLEKYHLALLQYLSRDEEYQKHHVYVDEFSYVFLEKEWEPLALMKDSGWVDLDNLIEPTATTNDFPLYRLKWNLAGNTNLEPGVKYMAMLNPREPSCFVMLGVLSLSQFRQNRDLNLAIGAFQKAIDLGSPQAEVLKRRIDLIKRHIEIARGPGMAIITGIISCIVILVVGLVLLFRFSFVRLTRDLKRKEC